ncbi:MAG: signal peptidase I [Myxococcota bacterium]
MTETPDRAPGAPLPRFEPPTPAWRKVVDWVVEVVRSWGPALLIVLVIRSILIEPFQIPSGSMVPTLAIGDFILVSKVTYGLRVPFTNVEIAPLGEPERGDVVVFVYPPTQDTERLDYIKRIVGLPGDTIEVRDDVLFVNGAEQARTLETSTTYVDQYCRPEEMRQFAEALDGAPHPVLQSTSYARRMADYGPRTVPDGHYFVMGDNRDNSADSRVWGFVPRENVRGKAMFVWLSIDGCEAWTWWNPLTWPRAIRWSRLGDGIR